MVSKVAVVPCPSVEINLENADLDLGAANSVLQDSMAQTHSNMALHDANIILDQEKWVNAEIVNSFNDLVVVLDDGEVISSKSLETCQKLRNTSTVEDGSSFYKEIILVWILQLGIGCPSSKLRVKNLCCIHNISVLVLLEPLISMDKLFNTNKILGFKHAFANVSNKIWVFWKEFVRIDFIGDFSQVLHCNIESSNLQCVASFVYAATSCSLRKILWDQLVNFHSICTLPWLVGGDFNTIVNPSERVGGLHPNFCSMEDFNNMIMNCNLIDIGFSGNNFTWNRGNLWQRLDRVLFNNDWVNVFNATKIPEHVAKLKRLKMVLNWWNKNVFKNIFSNIKEVEEKINALEACCQNDPTDVNFAVLKEAKLVLTNLQCQEETYWKQKAAIKFLAEGDNNTSYFHALVSKKCAINGIHKIDRGNGTFTDNGDEIANLAEENSSLCFAPPLEEVKNTLFDMNADSVAGPDGFMVKFFQHLWHVISEDVYDVVLDFFNGNQFPKANANLWAKFMQEKYCGALHPSLCISSKGHSKAWQRMVQINGKLNPV
ncbi:uncharacterized protein LOC114579370 [Dendrobium catenatum]|uniref:uncharacterized protein LOC114579370 n=1 Tax=Dendrobium catenatum TaxID=906689 RepID=UPI00109FE4EA|nr:uncharacterized protein LOC114579370 [Dendrobium catenatum]